MAPSPSPIPIFLALGTLCLGAGIYGVIGPNFYVTVFCKSEYRDKAGIDLANLDERNPLCHTSQIQEQVSSFESYANLVQGVAQLVLVAHWCQLSDKFGRRNILLIISSLYLASLVLIQVFRTYWYVFNYQWFILALLLDHSEVLGSLIILYFSDIWEPETYALYVAWFTGCFLLIAGTFGSTLGASIAARSSLLEVSSISIGLIFLFIILLVTIVEDDRKLRLSETEVVVEDTADSVHTPLAPGTSVSGGSPESPTESVESSPDSNEPFASTSSKPTYTPTAVEVSYGTIEEVEANMETDITPGTWEGLGKLNILSPIFVLFQVVPKKDHKNLICFSIINSLETAAGVSTVYIIALYVQYMFGWTPAELGKVAAFSSAMKFVMITVVTPVVIHRLNKYLSNRDIKQQLKQSNDEERVAAEPSARKHRFPLPDIPLIRFSMLMGAIYTTSVALTKSGTVFVMLQSVSALRSVAIPARATFAISLASRQNTGKLMGALDLISKLLQIPATSLFLKIYSLTVAKYPATVLLIVAFEEWVCLGISFCLRNYVVDS